MSKQSRRQSGLQSRRQIRKYI